MKKVLFIFNPMAGKTRILNRMGEIVDYYTKKECLVTVYPTQKSGDGYKFITNLNESYDLVVCGGGDGTLNEVISGLLRNDTKCRLGYLPFGSTNDFAKSICIPVNLSDALEISIYGTELEVDVGKANERYFIYVAAFGLFTDVPYITSQRLKNTFGYLAYILQGIKAITDLNAYSIHIEYNGKIESGDFAVGMVTNSISVGGFKYPIQEDIRFNDGIFEVLLIRMPRSILELRAIVKALLNEQVDEKFMLFIKTSELKIYSKQLAWTFDGEYGGVYDELLISNMNSAISINVPTKTS